MIRRLGSTVMKFKFRRFLHNICQSETSRCPGAETNSRGESGSSLVETAIILPLCLLLLGAIVDGGMIVQQYFMLQRIAYSASRMAVITPQLETGSYTQVNDGTHSHYELQQRIHKLIDSYGDEVRGHVTITSERLDDFQTVVTYEGSGEFSSTTPHDVTSSLIKIRVAIQYPSLLGQFTGKWSFLVSAESEGPYLALSSV